MAESFPKAVRSGNIEFKKSLSACLLKHMYIPEENSGVNKNVHTDIMSNYISSIKNRIKIYISGGKKNLVA